MEWYFEALRKYAVFSGRSRRQEFWMFVLFNMMFSILIGAIEVVLKTEGMIGLTYTVLLFIPCLAVTVRRLHDVGQTGWWLIVPIIPLIGIIGAFVMIYFLAQDSEDENEYGANPKLETV